MGVVRDVTVDSLVTAVGNIDTSSLAQDSTLQDVVTAIGNISGGSDPVTNTTVNSLCKDTTGQSIASAISGLGATLGSDRALIDGSNIASPATFRHNIEVNKLLVDSFTRSVTIAANNNTAWNAYTESAKNGYGAIGIIQFQTNNQNIFPINMSLDNSSYGIFLKNISGSSQTSTIKYTVLYVKND